MRKRWTTRYPDVGFMGAMTDDQVAALMKRLANGLPSERELFEKLRNLKDTPLGPILEIYLKGGSAAGAIADAASNAASKAGEEQEKAAAIAREFSSSVAAAVTTKIADIGEIEKANSGKQKIMLLGVAGLAAFLFFRDRSRGGHR